jgi:tether containing UBX domain for GLUT4
LYRYTETSLEKRLSEINTPAPDLGALTSATSTSEPSKQTAAKVTPPVLVSDTPLGIVPSSSSNQESRAIPASIQANPASSSDPMQGLESTSAIQSESSSAPDQPFQRDIKVFAPPPEHTPGPLSSTSHPPFFENKNMDTNRNRTVELPETFFELSSNELKYALSSLSSRVRALEDAPLMTKAMRDRQDDLKRQKYPKVRSFPAFFFFGFCSRSDVV